MLRTYFAREEGQGLVEYALITGFVAIVVAGALGVFGTTVATLITNSASQIP